MTVSWLSCFLCHHTDNCKFINARILARSSFLGFREVTGYDKTTTKCRQKYICQIAGSHLVLLGNYQQTNFHLMTTTSKVTNSYLIDFLENSTTDGQRKGALLLADRGRDVGGCVS